MGTRSGLAVRVLGGGLLLVLLAVGLKGNGLARAGCLALVVLACALMIARVNFVRAGIGASVAAAFTLPWNGLTAGSLEFGDMFIFIAIFCFIAADVHAPLPKLPPWITWLGFTIVIVYVSHVLVPTSSRYMANRVVVSAAGVPTVVFQTNFEVAVKYFLGIVVIPLIFCYSVRYQRKAITWMPAAFVMGTALSAGIAFSDSLGVTHLGQQFTGIHFQLARQGGLTKHPNFLASTCILAMPLALWMAAEANSRVRRWGIICGVLIAAGDYATGSRGGAVCLVLGVAAALVLIPAYRKRITAVLAIGASALVVALSAVPGLGPKVLKATRLSGSASSSTSGSNYVRSLVGHQGVLDFLHRPIDGIGLLVADEAQNVYLQQLASGGLLLCVAMAIYALGNLRMAAILMRSYSLAGALFAVGVASAVFNYLEADLTDRFFYVPTAITAMLMAHYRLYPPQQQLTPEQTHPDTYLDPDEAGLATRVRRSLDRALVKVADR